MACASAAEPVPHHARARTNSGTIEVRIRASTSNVIATLEPPTDPNVAGFVWVENRSADTVTVQSVTLRECENIRQACDAPIEQPVTLTPGSRHIVLRVLRKAAGDAWHVTFTYDWAAGGAVRHGVNTSGRPAPSRSPLTGGSAIDSR